MRKQNEQNGGQYMKKLNHVKRGVLLLFILSIFLLLSGCSDNKEIEPISRNQFLLGTIVNVTIYDKTSDEVFDQVFDRIKEIEERMSINMENSEVINVNNKSGIDFASVSDDTFYVIKTSKHYSELSEGNFDTSVGPLVKLWKIGSPDARIPSDDEINHVLPLINYKNVELNPDEKKVMLKEKDMIIDLGGIAKGYAADEIGKILKDHGIEHAIVNLGGNVSTLGAKPGKEYWSIGIQNPFEPRGAHLGIVQVKNKSVVTSGIYERFFEEEGVRYHHILSPYTGYPIDNSLASVSIVADRSIDADALSTVSFSLGVEKGLALIESLAGIDAIFITKDHGVYISSGLKENLKMTNEEFTLKN